MDVLSVSKVLTALCLGISSIYSSEIRLSDFNNNGLDLELDFPEFDFSKITAHQHVNESDHTNNFSANETDDEKTKRLENIFLGVYKNYKSTYLGNRTSLAKRKSQKKDKKKKKTKTKLNKQSEQFHDSNQYGERRYNVGPGVNVSLDMEKNVVSVNLDEDCLKDIFFGDWDDASEKGRGKKYDMISKILPLFILPFLIQSAIIPFLVTTLKLLLMKSILIGKLAIFILVISAIKNHQKMNAYEAVPTYWASEPSRRSESLSGYRVEGRPTAWINK